jgi:hypothetical protein
MSCNEEIVSEASKVTLQISITTQLRAPLIEVVRNNGFIDKFIKPQVSSDSYIIDVMQFHEIKQTSLTKLPLAFILVGVTALSLFLECFEAADLR